MKINCRKCDICGVEMDRRDFHYWLRQPVVKRGAPMLGMKRMDICDSCFNTMVVLIQRPELIKTEEEAVCEDAL